MPSLENWDMYTCTCTLYISVPYVYNTLHPPYNVYAFWPAKSLLYILVEGRTEENCMHTLPHTHDNVNLWKGGVKEVGGKLYTCTCTECFN